MAFCANCGQAISDLAIACPRCGHPHAETQRPVLELADFWMRFLALLLDGLILFIPTFVIGLVVSFGTAGFMGMSGGAARPGSSFGFFVPNFWTSAIGFTYHWLMIGLNNGQTIGKKVCGIRILKPDGTPVDLGNAAGRAGMALVSGIALYLGYLWAAWDRERRTWHDMVANTRAFKAPR